MEQNTVLREWATWALSPSLSVIVVTVLITLLVPLILHYLLHRQSDSTDVPTFLLIGPSGGGKTSLFTLFTNGTLSTTHTSQIPHTATCRLPSDNHDSSDFESEVSPRNSQFVLLDTPGHGKLRHHALTSLTSPSALKGLIFVVDSAAVSSAQGLTEAAEFLHDVLLVLQKRYVRGKRTVAVPVLVAANKQDVFTSLPAGLVKSRLEEEVGKVRLTKSKGLLDSGIGMEVGAGGDEGDEEEGNWLGEFGAKEFAFAQMEEYGIDVAVVGGRLKGEGDEAGQVKDWWNWVGENLSR